MSFASQREMSLTGNAITKGVMHKACQERQSDLSMTSALQQRREHELGSKPRAPGYEDVAIFLSLFPPA